MSNDKKEMENDEEQVCALKQQRRIARKRDWIKNLSDGKFMRKYMGTNKKEVKK